MGNMATWEGYQPPKFGFWTCVERGWTRAFDFEGRATQREYWYFVLFSLLLSMVVGVVYGNSPKLETMQGWVGILTFVPSLSLSIRRLHDVNRSAWNLLWFFTIIGALVPLLYWHARHSDRHPNTYGDPVMR